MSGVSSSLDSSDAGEPSSAAEPLSPHQQVIHSLEAAAEQAAQAGVPLDEFMHRAWSAYVDARPGMREQLADSQLIHQIQELRAAGKVGTA